MSTEKLTAEQSLKIYKIRASAMGDSISADEADGFIAGYRAAQNEVEHQTKQLREERDMAIKLLGGFYRIRNGLYGAPAHSREIDHFFNQLNQQNEG